MDLRKLYDETNPKSIEQHSLGLIDKSFKEILGDYFGSTKISFAERTQDTRKYINEVLGRIIEEFYFGYKPNRNKEISFPEAEIELKILSYEKSQSDKFIVKDDMIIDLIPDDLLSVDLYCTIALKKLNLVLLVLYLNENDMHYLNYRITYSKLLSLSELILKKDRDTIRSELKFIVDKIKRGIVYDITENDTTCLKVSSRWESDKESYKANEKTSEKLKKNYVLMLKRSYLSMLINDYLVDETITINNLNSDIVNMDEFEEVVKSKIIVYKGHSEKDLQKLFKMGDTNSKNIRHMLTLEMLGIKSISIEEFTKAKIIIKTIKVEKNGKIRQSMSFPAIKFREFILEEWEESSIYKYFTENRFLFIIYKSNRESYVLDDVKFWQMPIEDLQKIGYIEWKTVQNIIKEGVKLTPQNDRVLNNLPKKSETKMFHLRPHASKSAYLINGVKYGSGRLSLDCDDLPNGDKMTKQSFWLNNNYIEELVKKK